MCVGGGGGVGKGGGAVMEIRLSKNLAHQIYKH